MKPSFLWLISTIALYELALVAISVVLVLRRGSKVAVEHAGDYVYTISVPIWWWALFLGGPAILLAVWLSRRAP